VDQSFRGRTCTPEKIKPAIRFSRTPVYPNPDCNEPAQQPAGVPFRNIRTFSLYSLS